MRTEMADLSGRVRLERKTITSQDSVGDCVTRCDIVGNDDDLLRECFDELKVWAGMSVRDCEKGGGGERWLLLLLLPRYSLKISILHFKTFYYFSKYFYLRKSNVQPGACAQYCMLAYVCVCANAFLSVRVQVKERFFFVINGLIDKRARAWWVSKNGVFTHFDHFHKLVQILANDR